MVHHHESTSLHDPTSHNNGSFLPSISTSSQLVAYHQSTNIINWLPIPHSYELIHFVRCFLRPSPLMSSISRLLNPKSKTPNQLKVLGFLTTNWLLTITSRVKSSYVEFYPCLHRYKSPNTQLTEVLLFASWLCSSTIYRQAIRPLDAPILSASPDAILHAYVFDFNDCYPCCLDASRPMVP